MASLPGRIASPPLARRTKATLESIGPTEKHLAIHIAINGQVFWQSGTAGASSGQHGMLSGIAVIDIVEATAIATPLTGVVNGPTMSPTIARIGSRLRSQVLTFIGWNMSQADHSENAIGRTEVSQFCGRWE